MRFQALAGAACLLLAFTHGATAATITEGFTFTVASDGSDQSVGDHFHSNTGGSFGNPAGKAEVGSFSTEETRGLSEYNLTGLSSATSAFVTFRVFSLDGLFAGTNDFQYIGDIAVDAYAGNNLEDISDYEAASTGAVGIFNTAALLAGDTLSSDITAIFNAAIGNGDASLGIRLAIADNPNGGAVTFDSFRLTTDNQTSVVPVPAALPLLLAGLAVMGLITRRKTKQTV